MPLTVSAKQVTGGAEIEAKLTRYVNRAFKVKVRKAVSAGATVFLRAVRARTPRRTGFTARTLGTKIISYPSGSVVGLVGPRTGFKLIIDEQGNQQVRGLKKFKSKRKLTGKKRIHEPARIAHLIERSTKFLSSAFAASKGQAEATVKAKLAQELNTP